MILDRRVQADFSLSSEFPLCFFLMAVVRDVASVLIACFRSSIVYCSTRNTVRNAAIEFGTATGVLGDRVRVNGTCRRAGRHKVRVKNQDVTVTGYAPSR